MYKRTQMLKDLFYFYSIFYNLKDVDSIFFFKVRTDLKNSLSLEIEYIGYIIFKLAGKSNSNPLYIPFVLVC